MPSAPGGLERPKRGARRTRQAVVEAREPHRRLASSTCEVQERGQVHAVVASQAMALRQGARADECPRVPAKLIRCCDGTSQVGPK